MKYNNSKFTIYLPLVIACSIVIGLFLGKILWSRNSVTYNLNTNGNKIDEAIGFISKYYVDSISNNKLVEDALPALLAKLDPHSMYIPASEFNDVNDPLEGEFEGIGVQFNVQNDTVIVMQVISGGPSEKVNVKAGDRIVKVNDTTIAGIKISSNQVVKKLKGPRGTKVKIGILRRGFNKLIDIVITRDKIPFYSIDASFMADKETGYIKISRFATTTFDEFKKHSEKLREKGMKRLILDLRGNGGGVLQVSTLIANEFLESDKLIVYTEGRAFPREDYFSDGSGKFQDTKLAILIDEETASASEILAGSMQDNDRCIIVGRRSFGKGLVMEQQKFSDGSALRLTISRYYTPTGRCIQKPYDEDHEKYYAEIEKRFLNKEFEKIDSSKFPDSLKFYTPAGKIVYGGGGIMPDFFVPIDSLSHSKFYTEASSLIYDFAFDWADSHRKELEKFKTGNAMYDYIQQKNLFPEFVEYTKKNKIVSTPKDTESSKDFITRKISLLASRNILGDNAFFELWTKQDRAFKKALEEVKKM